jgi:hypothetical protein
MVVLAIIALAAGGIGVGLGALTRTNLRGSCMQLASVSRYAYQRAMTRGTTVRLTMDFETNTFSLDESEDPITLVRSDDKVRQEMAEDEDQGDPGAALNPWAAAAKKLENPDVLEYAPPPFSPIQSASGKTLKRVTNQKLASRVSFARVIVAHEEEPREEGRVDLFFFPNGTTQHAVVQLQDSSETIYSVELHPLTGKAELHDVPFEPEVLMDDPREDVETTSELEDPS